MDKTIKIASSRIEGGIEICNTCCRPADAPFRYRREDGSERGCIASCHDKHIAKNAHPVWRAPLMRLPSWITHTRRQMLNFERMTA